ncbi:Two-component system phosphate regulon sensor histidine kinase PhoR [Tenacibaculum sp. 190130A14a]|uniref:histidine kinase n=1 Tax=Tenacibaculum polynesiense TaxID=3137857 RepID=A0ABP1EUD6_9FLAO
MNTKKNRWILYLISITIVATIGIQAYWNLKNYQQNKQRVINEIQQSLDDAVEMYFTNISKDYFTIVEKDSLSKAGIEKKSQLLKTVFPIPKNKKSDSLFKDPSFKITSFSFSTDSEKEYKKLDSSFFKQIIIDTETRLQKTDTLKSEFKVKQITQFNKDGKTGVHYTAPNTIEEVQVFRGKKASDSLQLLKNLKTIVISIQNDSLKLNELDSIFKSKLLTKNINTSFNLNHFKHDTIFNTSKNIHNNIFLLESDASPVFLKEDERIQIEYTNPTREALKRSITGILLSLILSLAVISSLFYLLKIINQQKELAEIKNDLISNITHEFKTPITTVSTALEAINNFNAIDDKEKTKKYISISSVQIEKLHLMVEKLLETATLDSEKLLLKKEPINMVELIEALVKKHQFTTSNKTIAFSSNKNTIETTIDVFHFENAISNLIDNAIKYGGNAIEIHLQQILNTLEVTIADNGPGIEKNQQDKIFDKFYRIPKGNTHDVKGFGIGLYYTKKIIEKHNGIISLTSKPNNTVFKIVLNHE